MTTNTKPTLAVTGASAVFGQWGPFMDRVADGEDVIITYSREHGRDQGRSVSSEVRCIAISVGRYKELAENDPRPVPVDEIGSYKARQTISTLAANIMTGAQEGQPIHYNIFFKRQEASVRHRQGRRQELKAQPGYPRAYLVSARWYCQRAGLDLADLEKFALATRGTTN